MNKRVILLLHVAIWAMLFLSPLTFMRHDEDFQFAKYLMLCLSPLLLMIVFYTNYLWLVPRHFFQRPRQTYWVVNVLMVFWLGVLTHYWLTLAHNLFDTPLHNHHELTVLESLVLIIRDMFNLAVAAAVATAIALATRLHHSEEARLEAEAARAEAELKNLRSQINPHFLLNTLNNIYALTAFDTVRAQDAIQQLSKMLRHMLYDNQEDTVTLSNEIQFLENYVSLMKIRLPQNVDVVFKKDVANGEVKIAPLMFVSLVENAFKHGISPTEPSFVHISISTSIERLGDHDIRDQVICDIRNSNHPKTQQDRSGHGIGLSQVQRRLDLAYPHRYTWEKGVSDDGKTYQSRITIKV